MQDCDRAIIYTADLVFWFIWQHWKSSVPQFWHTVSDSPRCSPHALSPKFCLCKGAIFRSSVCKLNTEAKLRGSSSCWFVYAGWRNIKFKAWRSHLQKEVLLIVYSFTIYTHILQKRSELLNIISPICHNYLVYFCLSLLEWINWLITFGMDPIMTGLFLSV